ncbi:MAG TPA: GGDEF domain-containing protein, partial [Candidatus Limnocylindria bacterium]
MLLVLVFGVFLVLVGVTASALVAVASSHLLKTALASTVSADRALVELFVEGHLLRTDLASDGVNAARRGEMRSLLAAQVRAGEILRVQIRSLDNVVLFSSEGGSVAAGPAADSASVRAAIVGKSGAAVLTDEALRSEAPASDVDAAVAEFWPVLTEDGRPLAVVAILRDAGPILARVASAQRDVVLVMLAAAAVLAVILFAIFRAAHTRIARQHARISASARLDPLTGLLNHGALVALLIEGLEDARRNGTAVGVALLDVDNFRLFNDTHGHAAGDEVLLRVAGLVGAMASDGTVLGRYGPDEFLLVRPGAPADEMAELADQLRSAVAAETVQFGESECLPVTASAGVSAYPEHADSATELLSAAAVALAEARGGGGDATRTARGPEEERVPSGSFDVLQGLVIAVDTKDRYT